MILKYFIHYDFNFYIIFLKFMIILNNFLMYFFFESYKDFKL